jgi:hypothetical protein
MAQIGLDPVRVLTMPKNRRIANAVNFGKLNDWIIRSPRGNQGAA